MNELKTHIVIDPEIRFGKPCIKGTRITVGDILYWLSGGMSEREIMEFVHELKGLDNFSNKVIKIDFRALLGLLHDRLIFAGKPVILKIPGANNERIRNMRHEIHARLRGPGGVISREIRELRGPGR
jgi:hypothetical protein